MKSERVVSNPENHGWEEVNGKWIWASGRNTGHIVDGDTEGQIATWHDPANAWTPDNTVVVSGGNVGIGKAPGRKLDVEGAASAGGSYGTAVLTESGNLEIKRKRFPAIHLWETDTSATDEAVFAFNSEKIEIRRNNDTFLSFDSNGDATFSGTVKVAGQCVVDRGVYRPGNNCAGIRLSNTNTVLPTDGGGTQSNGLIDLGANTYRWKDGWFSGSVYATNVFRNGHVLTSAKDLIETLSTLRASTLDETVDVRQALASACDKLIEKFESMQEVATQEIDVDG